MKFKQINHISDLKPFVEHKKEIYFTKHQNGITICCYAYKDATTFDSIETIECRGIAFDENGVVVSRPLHKFFNVGEKDDTQINEISKKTAVYFTEKIDGSMVATCKVGDDVMLRTKASFASDTAVRATEFMQKSENIKNFCKDIALAGMTANFEYMDRRQPIVVIPDKESLRLLHVRDNKTGEYLTLDPLHVVWDIINKYQIEVVPTVQLSLEEMIDKAKTEKGIEGYVIQFNDGEMVKIKTDWYLQRHRAITFLRERDVALLALNETLDDTKSILREINADMSRVEEIEARVKNTLLSFEKEINDAYMLDGHLDRRQFFEKYQKNPLVSFMIKKREGRKYSLKDYFEQKILRRDFNLSVIVTELKSDEKETARKFKS